MTAKAYLMRTIYYTLGLVALVVAVNYLADPYAILGTPRIQGINASKADINSHVRLMKKYNPHRAQHNALVVGNNRVEIGFNPQHQCLQSGGMKMYNMGIPGANVPTQLLYTLNLVYQQPIKTVFLSLDFVDFAWTPRDNRFGDPTLEEFTLEGLEYSGAGERNPDYYQVRALDYFRSLFSLQSFLSSLRTLTQQDEFAADRDDAGFNPAQDLGEIVRVEGAGALFVKKRADLILHFANRWYVSDENGRLDPSFNDLKIFLDIAAQRQIKVYLFINPVHETYWDLLESEGHMNLYEEWLRELTKLAGAYSPDIVEFWDFSVDSPYMHEPVPPQGTRREPLQWFWELSYYRQQLGDLLLETMLSESCGSSIAFGERIQ